jgi:beta-glucosidase
MRDSKSIVSAMTLEEKAGLCSGQDFWHLKSVERLSIPSVMVSDGPHGLRKQRDEGDHAGINDSIQAVCFPPACALACSFDRALLRELGEAIGEEAQAEEVSIVLGPAINIKRSPLCGRNFEYFSEDPYLTGQLAAAQIQGLQSKNIGASLKHFAVNNQEYHRMVVSSELDERTLREIYLTAFEIAVKQAQPWTVMCSYNQINGVYASENVTLLNDILRNEWGFEGYVMSDWGAVNNRVAGLMAGMNLEMPGSGGSTDRQIIEAVREGILSEAILDWAVTPIVEKIFLYADNAKKTVYDKESHHQLAARFATESAVLLQNDGQLLPLSKDQKIAFIGGFARKPRFQGGGSSHINAYTTTNALDAAAAAGISVTFAEGFATDSDVLNKVLHDEAIRVAQEAQVAVIFAGLPDNYESEGYDRTHLSLPLVQNKLIEEIAAVQPHVVVVLHNGSPVELPWLSQVKSVLELYLGGQASGQAAVELLFGKANPCGKLAETFPIKLEDNPSALFFPGDGKTADYREGIFVGYRYYEKKKMPVLFPFGHGLSYTTFVYGDLRLDKTNLADCDTLTVSVDITNTGALPGKEIVQLYVRDETGVAIRPEKELKGFEKLSLNPGETKTAVFTLEKRSFAYYNPAIHDWDCPSGLIEILIGASSQDIRCREHVTLHSVRQPARRITQNTLVEELLADPRTAAEVQTFFQQGLFDQSSSPEANEAINPDMIARMMMESPLRALRSFYGYSQEKLDETIAHLNDLLK